MSVGSLIRWLLEHGFWCRHYIVARVWFYRIPRHPHHHRKRILVMNPITTTVPVQALVTITDNGADIKPDSVAWASNDAAIATVDATSGVVTPVGPGSSIITATCQVTTPSGVQTVVGTGTVTVTAVGDNLVATVDFQPITL